MLQRNIALINEILPKDVFLRTMDGNDEYLVKAKFLRVYENPMTRATFKLLFEFEFNGKYYKKLSPLGKDMVQFSVDHFHIPKPTQDTMDGFKRLFVMYPETNKYIRMDNYITNNIRTNGDLFDESKLIFNPDLDQVLKRAKGIYEGEYNIAVNETITATKKRKRVIKTGTKKIKKPKTITVKDKLPHNILFTLGQVLNIDPDDSIDVWIDWINTKSVEQDFHPMDHQLIKSVIRNFKKNSIN